MSHSPLEKKRAPQVHIKNLQLPQEDDLKYIGLHLTGDLPGTNTFSQNGNN
jgi:hypothetical protein